MANENANTARMRMKQEPEIRDPAVIRIAGRLDGALQAALLTAYTALKSKINLTWLVEALTTGIIGRELLDAVATLSAELQQAVGIITRAFIAAGESAAVTTAQALGVEFTLDSAQALAAQWARTQAAQLVTNLSAESEAVIRAAIRDAIASGYTEGITVEQTARRLQGVVGLTERQQRATENYYQSLLAKGVPEPKANALTLKYETALLKQRTLLIARTETARAAIEGQQAAWEQMVRAGLIDKDRMRQRWNVHIDERTCEVICVPMGNIPLLDLPKIGEPFTVPDSATYRTGEQIDGPPAHPACRCSLSLIAVDQS